MALQIGHPHYRSVFLLFSLRQRKLCNCASWASVYTDAENRGFLLRQKSPFLLVGGSRPQTPFSPFGICGDAPVRRFFKNTLSGDSGQLLQNIVGALPHFLLPTQYLLFRGYAKVEQGLAFGLLIFGTHIGSFPPPEAATIWWGSI